MVRGDSNQGEELIIIFKTLKKLLNIWLYIYIYIYIASNKLKIMKKYICIPILFCSLIFGSCTKSAQEIQAPSRVDLLFNQLKSEPKFLEYLKIVYSSMEILRVNISKTQPKDTSIISNKSLNFNQKYENLKFSGIEKMNENDKKLSDLFTYLSSNYDLLNTLTENELKLLYKKSYSFYFKIKTK